MITLSLMILLTLLAVGLLTLSSVALRAGGQGEAMASPGTTRGSPWHGGPASCRKPWVPTRRYPRPRPAGEEAGRPNPTGIWESWDYNPNSGSQLRVREGAAVPPLAVSGEDPEQLAKREFGTTPWRGRTVELVGKGALGEDATDEQRVVAGLVPVTHRGRIGGAFAWHVSDEAAKARINLYRKPAEPTESLARKRATLAGTGRPSLLKASGGGALGFLPKDLTVKGVRQGGGDHRQGGRSGPGGCRHAQASQRFRHDVTPYSLGLLTDVRRAG